MRDIAQKMGRRVRELRGARTQSEVADAAGIAASRLSLIENGKSVVGSDLLFDLARALHVDPIDLLPVEHPHRPSIAMAPMHHDEGAQRILRAYRAAGPAGAVVAAGMLLLETDGRPDPEVRRLIAAAMEALTAAERVASKP